jgi:CheY-like chemotaxis protein
MVEDLTRAHQALTLGDAPHLKCRRRRSQGTGWMAMVLARVSIENMGFVVLRPCFSSRMTPGGSSYAHCSRALATKFLEAGNGLEALDVWTQSGPQIDFLHTDVVMLKMGGRGLARKSKRAAELRPSRSAVPRREPDRSEGSRCS